MTAAAALAEILARPDIWRGGHAANAALPGVPSGFAQLDAELPGGGWPRGALTEILLDGVGLGEISLLLPALLRIKEAGGWSLLVAPPYPLHAPAWVAAGVDLARLAVISPVQKRDGLWAAEQALGSGAPAVMVCWAAQVDSRQVRRLQVAAAGSNALAFLFRPARAAGESSVAPLRLRLSAGAGGALGVHLLKRRGPPCHHIVQLDVVRPAKWRDGDESAVAGNPSAPSSTRSRRPAVAA
jgi:protein ImuA